MKQRFEDYWEAYLAEEPGIKAEIHTRDGNVIKGRILGAVSADDDPSGISCIDVRTAPHLYDSVYENNFAWAEFQD